MTYDEEIDEGIGCEVEAESIDLPARFGSGGSFVVQIITYGKRRGFSKGHPEGVAALTAADARELRDEIDDILRKIGEH